MSGIRGELRPHDAARGETRRRNAESGVQPSGQTTKIDATGGIQAGSYFTETPIIVKTPVIRGAQVYQFGILVNNMSHP